MTSFWRPDPRRGSTLAEALVACFMLLLLLAIVSATVSQYRRVAGQLQSHDESMDTALALQLVAREASCCINVVTTTPLRFVRIDPGDPNRLPAQFSPNPSPVPASWEPKNPAWMEEVSYSWINGNLVRQVRFADQTTSQTRVARGLAGFSATLSGQRLLQLSASLPDGRVIQAAVKIR